MAKLNTIQMIDLAVGLAVRANEVQQDPAVRKAWREAALDIKTAGRSVGAAAVESLAAWRRAAPEGTPEPSPLPA